jgi:ribonuclease Z
MRAKPIDARGSEMPRLHLLGTGSGLQNPQRGASAYLLDGPDGDVLLDAGEPVSATLARRGYDWSRLAGVVITHTHADHLGGLPMLVQQLHISGRANALALYGPAEFAEVAREHLALYYLLPEHLGFELIVRELVAGQSFDLGGCCFQPSATTHLTPYVERVRQGAHGNRCEAFALAVGTAGARVFYSGDVGRFSDIREAMQGARYAVVDSTHIDPVEVAEWADLHPETTVIFSHVSPFWKTETVSELSRHHARSSLRLAVEGESFEL